jgi:hypothetical protein
MLSIFNETKAHKPQKLTVRRGGTLFEPLVCYKCDYFGIQLSTSGNPSKARWLLFLSKTDSIDFVFRGVNIPFDWEFVVAQQEETVQLYEVYRVNATFPLEVHRVGNWSLANGLLWTNTPLYLRRNNLRGAELKVATTDVS